MKNGEYESFSHEELMSKWTPRQTERLILYYENEKDPDRLARVFNRSRSGIIRKLKNLGIYKPISFKKTMKDYRRELEEILGVQFVGNNLYRKDNLKLILDKI